ncbi:MAG: DUF6298 domain-containing protein [Planctomycetaceae bacterium]
MRRVGLSFGGAILLLWFGVASAADFAKRYVHVGADGRLVYETGPRGDRMPDYSHAGYDGGGVEPPLVPAMVVVSPIDGDDTAEIQRAIDHVSGRPVGGDGFRGAVLLEAGTYEIEGQLRIAETGVVLRGWGRDREGRTTLRATGLGRRALIRVAGGDAPSPADALHIPIIDPYVPCGGSKLTLAPGHGLAVDDHVRVEHPSTREWIAALGMDRFPSRGGGSWLDWKPGTLDLAWERVVTAVEGDVITLDAPLPMALDAAVAKPTVTRFDWPDRLVRVGIERLQLESVGDAARACDEDHAWDGVSLGNVRDAWVRDCSFTGFAGSAVSVLDSATRVTVDRCQSQAPRSEIGGWRRRTFFIAGGQTLVRDCTAEEGREDFGVGHLAPGPNAFVHCRALRAHGASGPLGSWATGVLYDGVEIDGGMLRLTNREITDQGAGWASANGTAWGCTAPVVECRMPPTAANWAAGPRGEVVGEGFWKQLDQSVEPRSLYAAQLRERVGEVPESVPVDIEPVPAPGSVRIIDVAVPPAPAVAPAAWRLAVENGWLTIDSRVVTGPRLVPPWWKGHMLPARAREFQPSITRFVPGREGIPFTSDLAALARQLDDEGRRVIEHHWGLWYDRRRDDHQTVRRITPEVWPPFEEQPWARSGTGTAWDGLSKYDLSRFNPWYFQRLESFAGECERHGLVLIAHMYFQHNILESAAHWMDFPWRPANCLQDTGFREPPDFVPGGRIDVAEPFYDVTHPVRRQLHTAYIRHCLDVLSSSANVIVTTGDEYTGPEHFVRFWLETVRDWRRETGRKVLVALSCTRDVQDAILADAVLAKEVDVIDLKYWWYTADGIPYAPPGGERLAPRQQLRTWKGPKGRSASQTARQVRELRLAHPGKAVICSSDGSDPMAVLIGGGSLAALTGLDDEAARAAVGMTPVAAGDPAGMGELRDDATGQCLVPDGAAGVTLRPRD